MRRGYYSDSISEFLDTSLGEILGKPATGVDFVLEQTQRDARLEEIDLLPNTLQPALVCPNSSPEYTMLPPFPKRGGQ